MRLFQQEMEEESETKVETKRLAILSQVIAENARKGMKLFREKSNQRHKTVI